MAAEPIDLGRRTLLRSALAAGGILAMPAALPIDVFARNNVTAHASLRPAAH